jgi:hypothetical protein
VELSNNNSHILVRLGEVWTHVALEVEVCELVGRLKLEQGSKLLVGVDLAAVLLVLEVVGANVLVDVAGHLRPGHLGAGGLLEKLGELVAD